jgi:hypothetical protein
MTAASTFTWDFNLVLGVLARAASLDDVGSAALVDDAANPPIPPQMPYAAQLNQWALQLAGMNRIIPALDIEVMFTGGNPAFVNVLAMSSLINTTWAQQNMTLTHVSTGVVLVSWPAGTVPPPRAKARAWITDPNPYPQPVVQPAANGVQIRTWNLTGAPADLPFLVSVL